MKKIVVRYREHCSEIFLLFAKERVNIAPSLDLVQIVGFVFLFPGMILVNVITQIDCNLSALILAL